MNKQIWIYSELPKYMKSREVNMSAYRVDLFMKLLKGKNIKDISHKDIADIYNVVLAEVEYKNRLNKNHANQIDNIFKFIQRARV